MVPRPFALVAIFVLAAPAAARCADSKPGKPAAWLALRSYHRGEARVQEFVNLMGTPGFDSMLLGTIRMIAGGLAGVDLDAPLAIAFPTLEEDPAYRMAAV